MRFQEWFVRWLGILVLAYITIFGLYDIARSETFEEAARNYGSDPKQVVAYVNEVIPATSTNCKEVSKLTFHLLRRYQHSNLKFIGVWNRDLNGHAFVTFTDRWGQVYVVTTRKINEVYTTDIVKVDSVEQFCNAWDKNWTYYFEYDNESKVLTKRPR